MRAAANQPDLPADAGLTVLELMIVLVILSLIGAVVSVQVFQQFDRAKVDIAMLQLRQLQGALTLYEVDMRGLPSTDLGLKALTENDDDVAGWRGPYLKSDTMLLDPWGQAVGYEIVGSNQYLLRSTGADKRKGGEGPDADIELASSG